MSLLTDTWRGLVQRRLWPIALVLAAALVATPFLLSEEPEPAPPVPAAGAAGDRTELAAQPIVAAVSAVDRESARHVIGAKKDPFRPAPVKKPKAAAAGESSPNTVSVVGGYPSGMPSGPVQGSTGGPAPASGGGAASPAPVVPGPVPTPETKPKKVHELYSLSVRWGTSEAATRPTRSLNRLKALPSVSDPVVIYLGVLEDEKTAVFMVDAKATHQGDGTCKPRPEDCQTVHLQAGETSYFDVVDDAGSVVAQYQLDLVKIRKAKGTAAKAKSSEAKGGRELLRERLAQAARYEFDEREGVLEKLPAKAAKAKLARLARVAKTAGF